jgi:hypothetical protein
MIAGVSPGPGGLRLEFRGSPSAFTFLRDRSNITGLVVVDRGWIVFGMVTSRNTPPLGQWIAVSSALDLEIVLKINDADERPAPLLAWYRTLELILGAKDVKVALYPWS